MEGLAEVSETGIADFEAGLGDVAFAGAPEVGGALEAGAAEPLREGEAGLAGGGAAEVEVAAGDAAAKFFEGGGFGQVFQEDSLDPSDALSGEPLGTGASPPSEKIASSSSEVPRSEVVLCTMGRWDGAFAPPGPRPLEQIGR